MRIGVQLVCKNVKSTCSFAPLIAFKIAFEARKNEARSGLAEKERDLPLAIVMPRYFHWYTNSIAGSPIFFGKQNLL